MFTNFIFQSKYYMCNVIYIYIYIYTTYTYLLGEEYRGLNKDKLTLKGRENPAFDPMNRFACRAPSLEIF